MEKSLFYFLGVCLMVQLVNDYTSNYTEYVVIGILTSSALWYGYCFLIKPLNIQRKLADVGYEKYFTENQWVSKDKLHQIRAMMRLRKKGALPPVYPNGWFALLDSDQVNINQVKYVAALGENFAVFRSSYGDVNILNAYCPHLGANMAVGGIVRGNCLQCPFHGWKFDGKDGKCVEIPNNGSNVLPKSSVRKWQSHEANGFIFVWYHVENEEPSWYPPRVKEISEWAYRGRSEHYVNAHIQDIPENGADVSHLSMLHGDMALGGQYAAQANTSLWKIVGTHKWKAAWKVEENQKHVSILDLEHKLEILKKFTVFKMNVEAHQIGPGLVVLNFKTSFGPIKLIQVVTPVEPMIQKVVHRIYCPLYLSLYGSIVLFMEALMFERDVVIWNHKTYIEKPLASKQEITLLAHRKWYKQFYSNNSHNFSFRKETMDW
ncbi:Rieske [2Fe-2S] iron-sulphur domain [Cinara cedri]|uniref:cholesterol 7-desaturase n=1 Tax=Cinara cedri TaxID=506608 RepID=A0A5E4M2W9_9HEMI|nr:Rieske [2Fe-2S] iron-sulphur domain [Cinara cedri]